MWNDLQANSTNFSSLNSFKCSLNSVLARHSAVYFFQILLQTVDFNFIFIILLSII